MRTSKPLTTICYCTPRYLDQRLYELKEKGIVGFWFWVYHYPEADEKKGHIHLYMEMTKIFESEELPGLFQELEAEKDGTLKVDKDGKPLLLSCLRPHRCNSFGDAYWYFLHDETYLFNMGQTRRYHYTEKDIHTPEPDYLLDLLHRTPRLKSTRDSKIIDMTKSTDMDIMDILRYNGVPMDKWKLYMEQMTRIRDSATFRNGKDNHEEAEAVDPNPNPYF